MPDPSLWHHLRQLTESFGNRELADVFRFVSFHPSETYGPHRHRRIEINYVKRGCCLLHVDGRVITFREDDMMVLSSDVPHLFEAGPEGATLLQLEFLPDIFTGLGAWSDDGGEGAFSSSALMPFSSYRLIKISGNSAIAQTVQRIVDELEGHGSYHRYLVVMHYAELLVLLVRYMDEADLPLCTNKNLRRAIAYLREHACEDICMADVAAQTDVSERQLRNLFVHYLHLSPIDYLNHLRVNRAMELLRTTRLSVKEVCFRCGFHSPAYFSRLFKQLTGRSPRQIMD